METVQRSEDKMWAVLCDLMEATHTESLASHLVEHGHGGSVEAGCQFEGSCG
jgi:hypothetical protein